MHPIRSTCAAAFMAVGALLAGCSTPGYDSSGIVASNNAEAKIRKVGFLTEPGRLKPTPSGEGFLCWLQPGVKWGGYDKVMIERIQVYLEPSDIQKPIDPTDLKMLVDYFHASLVSNLKGGVQIVEAPGPGVLRLRFALTSLIPTDTAKSLAGTAVPYGFVAEMGAGAATGRPVGSTPYMGQTGLEAQFRDGVSGEVVGECADTQIGLKYAADLDKGATTAAMAWMNGYVSSFTSWSYAKDAFNKWSSAFARRFAVLRSASQ
ncbi:DUF3313 domain-containing protein [Variovorax sp. J22P168]|uniref:DUF3313 domain-containing protein n=1 Tax=Variovorax jilinensis TaxID=3053513 RepID=UPI002577988D|nr:DUF3313 domain-containing protein [Variovorax sp. J22P168]MDM0012179.1 DUF3313 domain-containing protein [Variovorax sp. J22P168]